MYSYRSHFVAIRSDRGKLQLQKLFVLERKAQDCYLSCSFMDMKPADW